MAEKIVIDGEEIDLLEAVTGKSVPVKEKNFNNKWRREKSKKRRNRRRSKLARKARKRK